jgi:hypothetical protein
MSDRLVTLATFPSAAEAALARNVLDEGGIRSQLAQESSNWAFGGLIGSVTLLVFEGDVERADQLLDEALGSPLAVEDEPQETDDEAPTSDFAENLPDRSPPIDVPSWTCRNCGARVHNDERVCWSCGTSKKGETNPYFVRGESTIAPPPAIQATTPSEVPEHVAETIDRAWRAAWLGTVIFFVPLVNLYSAWLLLSVADTAGHLTGRSRRRFYVAFIVDVLVLGVAIMLAVSVFLTPSEP